jgi:hypothetical protein
MELDDNTDISNNANSTVTPCVLGVSMPKLTNDHGTNSADEAVLLNDKHILAGPANPNVQAKDVHPEPIPTTQASASLNHYLMPSTTLMRMP